MADTNDSQYTGLTVPNYNEILDDHNAKTKEIFGEDANVDASNSTLGMMNKSISYVVNLLYQKLQDTYYSRYLDSMTGIDLDRYGSNHGLPRSPAESAQVTLLFTGSPGTQLQAGSYYSDDNDNEFELTDNVTLGADGTATAIAESSEQTADANVAANTITTILELVNGLDSVTNPQQAVGGTEAEADSAYRARLKLADTSKASPTNNGLYTALYSVPGVQLVKVLEEAPNGDNHPTVLHFYVQGGKPQDIANAIQNNIAWGIETIGQQQQKVIDDGGNTHVIKFDMATVVPIYVSVDYTTTSDFDTDNGESDMRTSLTNYIDSLNMGETIDYNRFYQIVYNVNGIKTANVSIGTDPNNLAQSSIQLSAFDSANLANVKAVNTNG